MTRIQLGARGMLPGCMGRRRRESRTAGARDITRALLVAALCLGTPLAAHGADPPAADGGQLGHIRFEVSCNQRAQTTFNEAVAWLHSFEYERAAATFDDVLDRDPSCAMAYWGMAQSLWHQLWVTPPGPAALATGADHVRRAQELAPESGREGRYIDAISAFYSQIDGTDHRRRTLAYQEAMKELHSSYPEDREATTFYARALGAARMGDPDRGRTELTKLRDLRRALPTDASSYWLTQLEVQSDTADAWIAHAEGRTREALTLMRSAADLEDSVDKLPITPGGVLPARELLADMLLEQGEPSRALEEYEAVLRAAPNRFNALFGAGSAADRTGDEVKARFYYEAPLAQCDLSDGTRPALVHARKYLAAI